MWLENFCEFRLVQLVCVSHLQRQSHRITCNPGLSSCIAGCGSHSCTSWICSFIRHFAYQGQRVRLSASACGNFSDSPFPQFLVLPIYLHQNKSSHFSKQQLTKSNNKKTLNLHESSFVLLLVLPPKESPVFSGLNHRITHPPAGPGNPNGWIISWSKSILTPGRVFFVERFPTVDG